MSAKIIILVAFATTIVLGQDYASNPLFSAEKFEQTEHEKLPVKSYAQAFPNPTYSREMPRTWMGGQVFYGATLHPYVLIDQFKPGILDYILVPKYYFGKCPNAK
jgi:hypothetical protein